MGQSEGQQWVSEDTRQKKKKQTNSEALWSRCVSICAHVSAALKQWLRWQPAIHVLPVVISHSQEEEMEKNFKKEFNFIPCVSVVIHLPVILFRTALNRTRPVFSTYCLVWCFQINKGHWNKRKLTQYKNHNNPIYPVPVWPEWKQPNCWSLGLSCLFDRLLRVTWTQ